jgi:hypothetical protein
MELPKLSPTWITIITVLVSGLVGFSVHYIPGVKQDNPIEEKCEQIIKDKTGFDVDLTPSSTEKA